MLLSYIFYLLFFFSYSRFYVCIYALIQSPLIQNLVSYLHFIGNMFEGSPYIFTPFVLCSSSQCLIDFSNVHCSLRGSLWTVWARMWDVSAVIMENMRRDYRVSFSDLSGNHNIWTLAQLFLSQSLSYWHTSAYWAPLTCIVLSSNWISNKKD